jgi:ribosomal protein S18 acetylase RimI-like enzyme
MHGFDPRLHHEVRFYSLMATAEEAARPLIVLTDAPGAEAEAVIEEGLGLFNQQKAGYRDSRPLAVLISESAGSRVVGGLLGRTSLGLFFIDLFFVPMGLRGRGVGGLVLNKAEEEAKRRGCTAATLYTIIFQAPGFYERHGYRVLGRIECDPPGATRVCMSKRLVSAEL